MQIILKAILTPSPSCVHASTRRSKARVLEKRESGKDEAAAVYAEIKAQFKNTRLSGQRA